MKQRERPWRGVKKLEMWRVQSRRYDHTKVTTLWLYPELDCSSCIQEIMPASGEEQLDYFVDYIRRQYPHQWDADAVPIYWTVCGETDGFCEQAPFHPDDELYEEDVLSHFDPAINMRTGRRINWYQDLPVINHRFPEFAAAPSRAAALHYRW
jgi:hypothetical protein